jgi:membrane-associated protein
VSYPAARFRWYTALGVLLWAAEASLLGYLGGAIFESRPLIGLAVAWAGAMAVTGVTVLIQRAFSPADPELSRREADRQRPRV